MKASKKKIIKLLDELDEQISTIDEACKVSTFVVLEVQSLKAIVETFNEIDEQLYMIKEECKKRTIEFRCEECKRHFPQIVMAMCGYCEKYICEGCAASRKHWTGDCVGDT